MLSVIAVTCDVKVAASVPDYVPWDPQEETVAYGIRDGHVQQDERPRYGMHITHETLYAGNWVRCMRLPMLVLVSK